jgi:hypothetical protein
MVYTPVIQAVKRLRQKDHEFKANMGYIVRPCLKKRGGVFHFCIITLSYNSFYTYTIQLFELKLQISTETLNLNSRKAFKTISTFH